MEGVAGERADRSALFRRGRRRRGAGRRQGSGGDGDIARRPRVERVPLAGDGGRGGGRGRRRADKGASRRARRKSRRRLVAEGRGEGDSGPSLKEGLLSRLIGGEEVDTGG